MSDRRSRLQEDEYQFPYHHLPGRDFGHLRLGRVFRGGAEYMAYTWVVVERVRAQAPASVLDVGCGDGRLLAELASAVPGARRCGVDLDPRAVGFASLFAQGAECQVMPVELLDEHFDVVTCVETLEHLPDDLEVDFLAATAARVAPGGHLVVTVPSTARPVSAKHHRHYDTARLRAVLGAAAPELVLRELCEIVPNRRWLDQALRLLSNRRYSIDVGVLNERVLALHAAPVPSGGRGLHVLAVLQRPVAV